MTKWLYRRRMEGPVRASTEVNNNDDKEAKEVEQEARSEIRSQEEDTRSQEQEVRSCITVTEPEQCYAWPSCPLTPRSRSSGRFSRTSASWRTASLWRDTKMVSTSSPHRATNSSVPSLWYNFKVIQSICLSSKHQTQLFLWKQDPLLNDFTIIHTLFSSFSVPYYYIIDKLRVYI